MAPILYQNENLIIDSYSVFFVLAWLVGGIIFYREIKRKKWQLEQLLFVAIGCTIGALLGSYVLNVIFISWNDVIHHTRLINPGSKTIIGGITGGFIGVEITKKIIGHKHSTGDAFALAIPIGHAVGRIGCFLGGCCFGTTTSLPWGVRYPFGSVPYLNHVSTGLIEQSVNTSLAVHPTQLYEVLFNILLFIFLMYRRDSFKVSGSLFRLYIIAYAGFRFLTEFIRGDSVAPPDAFMKPVQWILLLVVAYFSWVFYNREIATKEAGINA